jgi:peptidoglycan/xylan/chitin deacetylase (PgdA/CDA1 family)
VTNHPATGRHYRLLSRGEALYQSTKKVIEVPISCSVFVLDCAARLAGGVFGCNASGRCVVLYYHSIPARDRCRFAWQMDMVRRLTTPIAVTGRAQLNSGRHYCAITFDDAFENVLDNAWPELKRCKIPFTLFVSTKIMGQRAGWWSGEERNQKLISAAQLQRLGSELATVGSHTSSHARLTTLSEADARAELVDSKEFLERLLGRRVILFSFPYGDHNSEVVDWCRSVGYERVFTTLPFSASLNESEFVVGRVSVTPREWRLVFILKLMGAYRWLPYAYRAKRLLLRLARVK